MFKPILAMVAVISIAMIDVKPAEAFGRRHLRPRVVYRPVVAPARVVVKYRAPVRVAYPVRRVPVYRPVAPIYAVPAYNAFYRSGSPGYSHGYGRLGYNRYGF